MKIIFLFLTLFFLNFSKFADDISDFEIEEVSIGNSLLNFYNKSKINKLKFFYDQASNKKFAHFDFDSSENFDKLNVAFKEGDEKFIIKKVTGYIWFDNDIENCLKKKNDIVNQIQSIFSEIKVENHDKGTHFKDKNSYTYDSIFRFSGEYPQNHILVACYDWSKSSGYTDHLRVGIVTSEYAKWLNES